MFWVGDKHKKPDHWGFDKSLVAPEWGSIWGGLRYCLPFWERGNVPRNIGQDRSLPAPSYVGTTPIWSASDWGMGLEFDGLDAQKMDLNGALGFLNGLNGGSLLAVLQKPGSVGADNEIAYRFDNNTGVPITQFLWNINAIAMRLRLDLSGGTVIIDDDETLYGSTTVVHAWNYLNGVGTSLWRDGILVGRDTTTSGTIKLDGGTMVYSVGGFSPVGAATWDGHILAFLIWDRYLSDGEIQTVSRNPFGLIRMAEDAEWLAVAAAGGANPHGPLGHPLWGPLAGPVVA